MREFNLKDFTHQWMGRTNQFRSSLRGTFWPSEASALNRNDNTDIIGKCLRASYYRLTGVKETNPPSSKSQVIFLLGRKAEDAVVEIWKQAGIWDNNSVRFEDKARNISGEFDCVLRNPLDPEKKFGVEVKSFWGYMQEKNILGYYEGRGGTRHWVYGHPKDENLMQAAIYCDQTREQLQGFKLFYISRDNCELAEFNITVDDNGLIYIFDPKRNNVVIEQRFKMEDIYARWSRLAEHLRNNDIPTRDFKWKPTDEEVKVLFEAGKISKTANKDHTEGKERYKDWHCSYCSYCDHCWRE